MSCEDEGAAVGAAVTQTSTVLVHTWLKSKLQPVPQHLLTSLAVHSRRPTAAHCSALRASRLIDGGGAIGGSAAAGGASNS